MSKKCRCDRFYTKQNMKRYIFHGSAEWVWLDVCRIGLPVVFCGLECSSLSIKEAEHKV